MTTANRSKRLVYLITDRRQLARTTDNPVDNLIHFAASAIAGGVDMLQVREAGLSAREVCRVLSVLAGKAANCKILVNDRADLAAAYDVGVHLTTRSLPVRVVRETFGERMLIGVSTHSMDEVAAANSGGADFVVFGPVFETESKKRYGPPAGTTQLEAAALSSRIPVLALGGLTTHNFREAMVPGVAGVAGISMFARSPDLAALVKLLKETSAEPLFS